MHQKSPGMLRNYVLISALSLNVALAAQDPVLVTSGSPELRNVLFLYQTRPALDALVQINSLRERHPKLKNNSSVILMLASLNLTLDQLDGAENLLASSLITQEHEQEKNRLLLQLAASYYQRGNYEKSDDLLHRVNFPANDALVVQQQLQQGMTHLARGDLIQSAKSFLAASTQNNAQGAYAQYNLGIALFGLQEPTEAMNTLNLLGQSDFNGRELEDIKDFTNIRLAMLHISNRDYSAAKNTLERVRLNANLSNQALLTMGWIAVLEEKYQLALPPFMELYSRPPVDNAVVESYLALPYSLAKEGDVKQSLGYYEQSVAFFERQRTAASLALNKLNQDPRAFLTIITPTRKLELTNDSDILIARISQKLLRNTTIDKTVQSYAKLLQLNNELPSWVRDYQNKDTRNQLVKEKSQLDHQVAALSGQLNDAIAKHEHLLHAILSSELQNEIDKLSRYLIQAQFAMAQTYEKILNQQ